VVGASTVESLEEAVKKYKVLAKQVAPHSEQAKNIIRRLVQLRMKLFEAKVYISDILLCVIIWILSLASQRNDVIFLYFFSDESGSGY